MGFHNPKGKIMEKIKNQNMNLVSGQLPELFRKYLQEEEDILKLVSEEKICKPTEIVRTKKQLERIEQDCELLEKIEDFENKKEFRELIIKEKLFFKKKSEKVIFYNLDD